MLISAASVSGRWAPPAVPVAPAADPGWYLCFRRLQRGRSGLCTKSCSPSRRWGWKLVSHQATSAKVSEPEAEVRRGLGRLGIQGDAAVGRAGREAVRAAAPALLPPPRPRRGAVNKACRWEADLPLRPARLRPPRPSSALQKPPPAAGPGDHRGNGSTSQVKLCISCVFRANADLGAQKGRDRRGPRRRRGAGTDLASGGRGAWGPACARPARTAGRARRPRRGASRSARAPSSTDSPDIAAAGSPAGRRPRPTGLPPRTRFPFLGAGRARSGGLGRGCRKRCIMEPFIGSRWPGARADSGAASMLV